MKSQGAAENVLTGQQSKVLALLAGGSTIEAAASESKVNPSTVHAWLKKEPFAGEYKAATRIVIEHATTQLKAATGEAVSTLRAVAGDDDAPASSRVSAAKTILELAYRAVELDDLAERIQALEKSHWGKD
jgi:hypothetical protein